MSALGRLLLRARGFMILLGAVAAGLLALASNVGSFGDPQLQKARAAFRERAPSGQIVLVELDTESLRTIGQWPWPRRVHADLIDRLDAAGAARIAFDIDFSSPSDAANDARLASAIDGARATVVLGAMAEHDEAGRQISVSQPIAAFGANARVAALMTPIDDDGVMRNAFSAMDIGGRLLPGMSTALLGKPTPAREARFVLDPGIDLAAVPRLRAADVIRGRFDPALVRGRSVIIGATAMVLGDRALLFGAYEPGVLSHVLGAETMLAGRAPHHGGAMPALGLVLLATLGIASIRSRAIAVGIAGVTFLTLLVAPVVLEATMGLYLHVVAALIMLATALALRLLASLGRSYFTGVSTNDLSGLPNAHALHMDAPANASRHVAVARIGNLNAITSVLGDDATGELLRRVSERIALGAEGAAIYHIADAEFLWLIEPGTEGETPDRFEALHALLSAPIRISHRPIDVAITFGLCTTEPNLQVATRAATLAAERAQLRGWRWTSHTADEQDEINWRMALLGELDSAIDAGQLWVAYQPKFDMGSRSIVGAEALVRWQHPDRGAIPPDHFVPIAEENGRIVKLTRFVIETALADVASIPASHGQPVVAVNLSTTLLTAPGIVKLVDDALQRHGVRPEQLILEITESVALTDNEEALDVLGRFRAMGIGVSIDDYGTGQSSLAYLKALPATELKIDQSFVRAIVESRSDEILVNSTIQLGHQLGMKVVAEGVETAQVLERLEAFGCDTVQGYLIGRPTPFAEFARLWRQPRVRVAAA